MVRTRPRDAAMYVLSTGFLTGLSPVAPGTAGSLLAALLFLPVRGCGVVAAAAAAAVLTAVSFPAAAWGVRRWGRDPSRVTIDEMAGCWLACLAAPPGLPGVAAAFVLFRIFDILKPWPARRLDRMEGSAGVVLDDIAAGVMAALVLLAWRWISGHL